MVWPQAETESGPVATQAERLDLPEAQASVRGDGRAAKCNQGGIPGVGLQIPWIWRVDRGFESLSPHAVVAVVERRVSPSWPSV